MTKPWYPDEIDHAGPEHLEPDFVAGFDRKQGYPDVEADVRLLRDRGVLHADSTLVDLGAGTGRFARAAAAHARRVVAVDVSAAMVDHLRREINDEQGNVEVVQAGFLTYEHIGEPADAVHCRHALHQLPDFWKGIALQRIAAMLRPGGVLRLRDLVYDTTPGGAPAMLERWMSGAVEDPTEGYTSQDYADHIRTEFSTYTWLLEPLLAATGFEIVDRHVAAQVYAAYTCVRM